MRDQNKIFKIHSNNNESTIFLKRDIKKFSQKRPKNLDDVKVEKYRLGENERSHE